MNINTHTIQAVMKALSKNKSLMAVDEILGLARSFLYLPSFLSSSGKISQLIFNLKVTISTPRLATLVVVALSWRNI